MWHNVACVLWLACLCFGSHRIFRWPICLIIFLFMGLELTLYFLVRLLIAAVDSCASMCRSRHDRMPRHALPELLPDWFLDALVLNSALIPRAESVGLNVGTGLNMGPLGLGDEGRLSLLDGRETGTVPGLPPPLHGKCKFFVMRSINLRS